jgi:hypothetical protein
MRASTSTSSFGRSLRARSRSSRRWSSSVRTSASRSREEHPHAQDGTLRWKARDDRRKAKTPARLDRDRPLGTRERRPCKRPRTSSRLLFARGFFFGSPCLQPPLVGGGNAVPPFGPSRPASESPYVAGEGSVLARTRARCDLIRHHERHDRARSLYRASPKRRALPLRSGRRRPLRVSPSGRGRGW